MLNYTIDLLLYSTLPESRVQNAIKRLVEALSLKGLEKCTKQNTINQLW
ncbi:14561_t:CDS:2, partial [Ambispora leptoticha]